MINLLRGTNWGIRRGLSVIDLWVIKREEVRQADNSTGPTGVAPPLNYYVLFRLIATQPGHVRGLATTIRWLRSQQRPQLPLKYTLCKMYPPMDRESFNSGSAEIAIGKPSR